MIRTVSNEAGGCGKLKRGGYYLNAPVAKVNGPSVWTVILGDQIAGLHNTLFDAPSRRNISLFNIRQSLATGRLITDAGFNVEFFGLYPGLKAIPEIGLIDHVGKAHYTPPEFAAETIQRGPSRHLPEATVRMLAPHLPLPVVFTHDMIPVVSKRAADAIREAAPVIYRRTCDSGPTYASELWGPDGLSGASHWAWLALADLLDPGSSIRALLDNGELEFTAQPFGLSWFTGASYIMRGDESHETLDDLLMAGIEPVQIEATDND